MGGKKNKNKTKKVNAKREKYLKFRKEKPATVQFDPPELDNSQQKQAKEDEERLGFYMRTAPRYKPRYVSERKYKSKRGRV